MNTKDVGDLAEAKVRTKLIEMGYIISEPHTENCQYDFIADDGSELEKVQVKSASLSGGTIDVSIKRTNPSSTGTNILYYDSDEVDVFVVYCPDNKNFYRIPFDEAPSSQLTLRVEETINMPSIRWAEEYEF